MGTLAQALEIIFEVQRKRINEKITKKEKAFQLTKSGFFLLFRALLLSNLITFLFLIHYKQFKMLQENHLKFYKIVFEL
jgi:hypothetical protein